MTVENARRRLRHFESRYRSLDRTARRRRALSRVLEVGSGLSFRGLELARSSEIFYLDTDLPDIVALKTQLVATLHPGPLIGALRVQALNALDREAFDAALNDMPKGALAIANEGLLVYLDDDEKCALPATCEQRSWREVACG